MSGNDGTWLPDLTETLALPLWAGGALLVLLVVLTIVAFVRAEATRTFAALARYSLFVVAVLIAWAVLNRVALHERAAERRALDARAADLAARAMAPGSALACIDGTAGETVAVLCERAVFASPETVAAGVAYVAAQLGLLADALDHTNRFEPTYEETLAGLLRAVELDRFGFVAHVFAERDGCTAEKCPAFTMLRDASRVSANLKQQSFQMFVGRNSSSWTTQPSEPAANKPAANEPAASEPMAASRPPAAPSTTNLNFPSAASIPPVSIMNPEPTGTPPAAAAAPSAPAATAAPAAQGAAADPPAPPRRPTARRPAANPQGAATPPVQIVPQPPDANASARTRAQ